MHFGLNKDIQRVVAFEWNLSLCSCLDSLAM